MSQDVIADMLTKIRNASKAKHEKVDIPMSKVKLEITKIFKNEGFIKNFKLIEANKKTYIRTFLKYDTDGNSVITGIDRVSKPGLRVYKAKDEMPRIFNGLGVVVVSTSKGIITGKKSKEQNIGGEVICYIW